jgi:DNA polymerase III subunit epsilon
VSRLPLFVAFDLETTGLIAGVDRIVECAAVAFQGEDVVDAFARLVDPGMPIGEDASRVNGLTDGMVKGAPPIGEVLPDFASFLGRGVPVAHNAVFDVGFLCAALDAAGMAGPPGPVLDTRGLARRAFPGRRSYSLESLIRDLDLGIPGAHRALADAHACRLLFGACAGTVLPAEGDLTVEQLAEASGPALDFGAHAPRAPRTAAILGRALAENALVDIRYRDAKGEDSERRIRPLAFTMVGGSVAVRAFCMLRNEERIFRLDSIMEARACRD